MALAQQRFPRLQAAPTVITSITVARRPRHGSNRLFEWMTAAMMIGIAVTIAVSPHAVEGGGFHLMKNLGLTPMVLVVFFMIASIARAIGLYANGRWPVYGPWCRTLGAAAGAVIWAQMLLSLIKWSDQSGYVSLGVPVYLFLAMGELISCYRAASDAQSR